MSDPVQIAAEALAGRFDQTCDAVEDTLAVMTALHSAGWRIVRTSTCACGVADDAHDPSHERYPTDERIVDEWTPEADRG